MDIVVHRPCCVTPSRPWLTGPEFERARSPVEPETVVPLVGLHHWWRNLRVLLGSGRARWDRRAMNACRQPCSWFVRVP